jgi:hypothetical protein
MTRILTDKSLENPRRPPKDPCTKGGVLPIVLIILGGEWSIGGTMAAEHIVRFLVQRRSLSIYKEIYSWGDINLNEY